MIPVTSYRNADRVQIVEPGRLHPAVTFTRSTTATYRGADGLLKTAAANEPRWEYDAQGNLLGLLIENAATNVLLNSATLATQSVTVTAAARTLSFTGTGTVTLSGAGSGVLVGTGANDRVSLTFTPTAGPLTLTVSGSVTTAQLETGFLSTYIPTTTAAVTRAADDARITNLSLIGFSAAAGTMISDAPLVTPTLAESAVYALGAGAAAAQNETVFSAAHGINGKRARLAGYVGSTLAVDLYPATTFARGDRILAAFGYAADNNALAINGGIVTSDNTGVIVPAARLAIGRSANNATAYPRNGHIKRLSYIPRRLTNAELQAVTA